ncbi:hypothetical protein PROFUN_04056 [Planoprotostelium fungivorum]|uniref:Uncharacterized protein n=1 Tax=Planoprotostelium fungivorum TaxID=1890364 RepID=A0A2P6NW96_9EUKA|nr:hypothetical protein PROFUN_04056 [Planoprotostelium fungivorum]
METESADDFLQKKAAIKRGISAAAGEETQLYESTLLRDLQIFESSVQKTKSTLEMLDRQEQEDRDLMQSKSREEESVKHKEEYEQLCATIETLPSRHREIQRMMQEEEMLEEKISLIFLFHLFLYSLDLLCGPQTEDKQNCNSAKVSSLWISGKEKRSLLGKIKVTLLRMTTTEQEEED